MSHEVSDGRPCGRPDGHEGFHRSVETMERDRERARAYRENNRARLADYRQSNEYREKRRAYNERNAERIAEYRRKNRAKKHAYDVCRRFGLLAGEYEKLKSYQGGKCAICQRATGRTKRLAVDHDHKTRQVRGLLCSTCNHMLGHGRDNASMFLRAIEYLNDPPAESALGRIPVVPKDSSAQRRTRKRRA